MGSLRRFIILILASLLLAGCGKTIPKDTLVIWTAFQNEEFKALQAQVEAFQQKSNHKTIILQVPFNSLRQKILVAGPALQGPDVLIGPHDWVGLLQTAGLLAPIPKEVVDPESGTFYEICTKAATFDGDIYLAPMMMECVVLARNTDICPQKPESLDELVEVAVAAKNKGGDIRGFAYELDNFYFSWAFMAGHGATFLDPFFNKDFQLDQLKFDTPEAVAGVNWIADLQRKHQLVAPGLTNDLAVDFFLNKKLGMMLCGPWNLGAIRQRGINYSLEPLPPGPKGPSTPFVGVTGAMLSKFSAQKDGTTELLTYLSSAEIGAQLCQSSGRAPVRKDTAELLKERVDDPRIAEDLALFSEAAQTGMPLPNNPAMQPVWDYMKPALELVIKGKISAEEALKETTETVRTKVRFMME